MPWLSGHGCEPDCTSGNFSAEVQRIATSVREHFDSRPARLLAYSMGARLGIALLSEHAELFTDAFIVGANPGIELSEERGERRDWEDSWVELLHNEGLERFEHQWRQQKIFTSQKSLPFDVRKLQSKERLNHTASGLAHAMRVLGLGSMPDLWPLLPGLERNMHMIVGASDGKFLQIAKRAAKLSDRIQLSSLVGIGHNAILEAPSEVKRLMELSS